MARKITVENAKEDTSQLRLMNGDIIIVNNRPFLVSTYGSQSDLDNNYPKNIRNYCSLINLDDGSRAFKDPITRDISLNILLSMFYFMFDGHVRKEDFRHIGKDNYDFNIKVYK